MAFCENYNYMKDSWDSIGIANFRNIFTGPDFLKYLKTTCIIVFVSVPASIIISLFGQTPCPLWGRASDPPDWADTIATA